MHQVLFIHPAPIDGRLGHPHPLIIGTQVAVVVLLQGSFEHPQSCRLPSSAEWPQVGLRGRIEDRGGLWSRTLGAQCSGFALCVNGFRSHLLLNLSFPI